MIKYILAALAACFFVISPALAHPPHGGHPGHGPVHNVHWYGKTYKGVTYSHYCYHSTWRGWHHQAWCPRFGCYVYWCPVQLCWYRCDGVIYIPIDNACNPNIVP